MQSCEAVAASEEHEEESAIDCGQIIVLTYETTVKADDDAEEKLDDWFAARMAADKHGDFTDEARAELKALRQAHAEKRRRHEDAHRRWVKSHREDAAREEPATAEAPTVLPASVPMSRPRERRPRRIARGQGSRDDPDPPGLDATELAARLNASDDERVQLHARRIARRNKERAVAELVAPLVAAGFVKQRVNGHVEYVATANPFKQRARGVDRVASLEDLDWLMRQPPRPAPHDEARRDLETARRGSAPMNEREARAASCVPNKTIEPGQVSPGLKGGHSQ